MTIQRVSVDRTVLPASLLVPIKAHLRVEHDRDDTLIGTYIAAAVSVIEAKCNVNLDPAVYRATADELRGRSWPTHRSYALPLNNVREVLITDDAEPPNDVTAGWVLANPDFGGNGSSYLVVAAGTDPPFVQPTWLLEMDVGVLDGDELAPGFFALIARVVGSFYENREASTALWSGTWDAEMLAFWRPCA